MGFVDIFIAPSKRVKIVHNHSVPQESVSFRKAGLFHQIVSDEVFRNASNLSQLQMVAGRAQIHLSVAFNKLVQFAEFRS